MADIKKIVRIIDGELGRDAAINTVLRMVGNDERQDEEDGGPGSGNWGHKGRPGKRGGSGKGTGGRQYRSGSREEGFKRNEEARKLRSEGKEVPKPPKSDKPKKSDAPSPGNTPKPFTTPNAQAKTPEQWKKSLTPDQDSAVKYYVSGDGMWINQELRKGTKLSKEDESYRDDLDKAIASYGGAPKDMKLYRSVDIGAILPGGMRPGDLRELMYEPEKLKKALSGIVGRKITDQGYMSTTQDKDIAAGWEDFTGSDNPIVLDLNVPKGTPGADLESFDLEDNPQKEFILARGTSYRITGYEIVKDPENGWYLKVNADIIPKKQIGKIEPDHSAKKMQLREPNAFEGYNNSSAPVARSRNKQYNIEANTRIGARKVKSDEFVRTLESAKSAGDPRKMWRVDSTRSAADFDAEGITTCVTPGGSTYALKKDGDIISVSRKRGDQARGADILAEAVRQGGDHLDSYDGNFDFYTQQGFEPVSWCAFDEEYAPDGWERGVDRPEDVIFFKYVGIGNVKHTDLSTFKKSVKRSENYDAAEESFNADFWGGKR